MKSIMVPAVMIFGLATALAPATGMAKGCMKGAAVGGVAGHVAGHHGVLGAGAGCVVGHHEANKHAEQKSAQAGDQSSNSTTKTR